MEILKVKNTKIETNNSVIGLTAHGWAEVRAG